MCSAKPALGVPKPQAIEPRISYAQKWCSLKPSSSSSSASSSGAVPQPTWQPLPEDAMLLPGGASGCGPGEPDHHQGGLWPFLFVSCYVCYAAWGKISLPTLALTLWQKLDSKKCEGSWELSAGWYSHFLGCKLSYRVCSSWSLGAVSLHFLSKTIK